MDWSKLIQEFLKGEHEAIQAVFTILGFLVGIVGTFFVAKSFIQQTKINSQQYELNRIAGEKHRRSIRPNFQLEAVLSGSEIRGFTLKLQNAIALNISLLKCDEHGKASDVLMSSHNAWEPGETSGEYAFDSIFEGTDAKCFAIINFSDEDGTKYQQYLKHRNKKLHVTFPMLV